MGRKILRLRHRTQGDISRGVELRIVLDDVIEHHPLRLLGLLLDLEHELPQQLSSLINEAVDDRTAVTSASVDLPPAHQL